MHKSIFCIETVLSGAVLDISVKITVLSKFMNLEMNGWYQNAVPSTSQRGHLTPKQLNMEMKEYKRGYFSVVVATMLARARRECDDTDDITAAAANMHISNHPQPARRENNPFKF
uniref:Uncharacterized protein n=1 Tax=Heliothis virescens TaxID=7102 RepID=A0A2A4JTC3_HELVI